ncbi:MAG: hypothetical protein IKC63_06995 [Clostridia bacterium]|nr:hypothetical protein [Clostridia bacterium]
MLEVERRYEELTAVRYDERTAETVTPDEFEWFIVAPARAAFLEAATEREKETAFFLRERGGHLEYGLLWALAERCQSHALREAILLYAENLLRAAEGEARRFWEERLLQLKACLDKRMSV